MINRAEQTIDKELFNRITAMERELQALKTPQPVGGSTLTVERSNLVSSTVTLPAGAEAFLYFSIKPTVPGLMLAEFAQTYYIDVDGSFNHQWPDGPSLTADQKLFDRSVHFDWGYSNDAEGKKWYTCKLKNTGANAKTVYLRTTFYHPRRGVS